MILTFNFESCLEGRRPGGGGGRGGGVGGTEGEAVACRGNEKSKTIT